MTHHESTICHNGLRKLHVKILLVCYSSAKLLLAQQLAQGGGVIVSVVPDNLACLRIAGLHLPRAVKDLYSTAGSRHTPSLSSFYSQGAPCHRLFRAQRRKVFRVHQEWVVLPRVSASGRHPHPW